MSTTVHHADPEGTANGTNAEWHPSACVLCSINCGIEVRLGDNGRTFERIRGNKQHPGSLGYTCEKALRIDHYQNGVHRLTSPMRRTETGDYEAVDWDTAIREVSARLAEVRDTHGGNSIFYYGGGGQGNHLGGGFGGSLRAAVGSTFSSNALAQEKTGEFWVDGQLFGRPRCHTTGDFERAEVVVFLGKNPWQSHGFPRARTVLKAINNDPARSMIVIDPRRTETAELADIHLQLIPGTDAWCLTALLAVLVTEDLVDHDWIEAHTVAFDDVAQAVRHIDIASYCTIAGLAEADVRSAARRIAAAASVSIFEDLGIQQAPHSTLNSYLEKLVFLVTGNFGKQGAMNIHTKFASLGGGGQRTAGQAERRSPVTGSKIITGLIPGAVIPDEILSNHPDRFRAMIVESGNPVHSLPDSPRMREAFAALDFSVVIDVAMTETARCADYVLPASSQFEKWEMTFFTLEFPHNVVHLRRPVLAPLEGTLPEPEIHKRLVRALGGYNDDDLVELRAAAAESRATFADAFFRTLAEKPHLAKFLPLVLMETLGETLGAGNEATAAAWGLAQTCYMSYPEAVERAGHADGNALFDAMLNHPEGVTFTIDEYDATMQRIDHPDGRIHLAVSELMDEWQSLGVGPQIDEEFPFVLSAGERRSGTANTIFRDNAWRKKDAAGALRLSPQDAAGIGVSDGDTVRVTTARGSAVAPVEVSDAMRSPHISIPNGLGLTDEHGETHGVAPNELTSTDNRDWLAGTPLHKYVRARLERVG